MITTTNDPTLTHDDAASRELTDALLTLLANFAFESDPYDTMLALRPMLTDPAFYDFCRTLDACPIHMTDLDSCADDDLTECAHLR